MKNDQKRYSLYTILGVIVASVMIVALIVQLLYIYFSVNKRLSHAISDQTQICMKQLKKTIKPKIESMQVSDYETIIENKMAHQAILAITIDDHNMAQKLGQKSFVVGRMRNNDWIVTHNLDHIKQIEQNKNFFNILKESIYTQDGKKLATITIYGSRKSINDDLNHLILNNFLFILIIYLIIFLIIIYFTKKYILSPIVDISESLNNLDEDGVPKEPLRQYGGSTQLYALTTAINIMRTQIKQNKDTLKQKNKEQTILLSLFDLGDSVLFKWNNDKVWSIESVSANSFSLFGYTQEEFLEHNVNYIDCVHPDDLNQVTNDLIDAITNSKKYFKHKHYRIISKEGKIKWVMDYTVILRDKDDNITHFIGYITDITEEKKKDRIIAEQSKLASMGEMIGNIAHQWRQPLSVISTAATGMKMQKEFGILDDKTFSQNCDMINENAQYLSETIDDFRNFIKNEKSYVDVDIANVLDKSIKMVESSLRNNNITTIIDIKDSITIQANYNELTQAFINILNNSKDAVVDYIKNDETKLIFITTKSVFNGLYVEIKDNGGGISADIEDRIFEPYFTTKHQSVGTGIGLDMVYKILVERYKASIDVQSPTYTYENKSYKGASFKIFFEAV